MCVCVRELERYSETKKYRQSDRETESQRNTLSSFRKAVIFRTSC